jgi:hypothetical protein
MRMGHATFGQAALAAGIVAFAWTAGGLPRQIASVVVLAVLLKPGPSGDSVAAGLLKFTAAKLQ